MFLGIKLKTKYLQSPWITKGIKKFLNQRICTTKESYKSLYIYLKQLKKIKQEVGNNLCVCVSK